MHADAVTRFAYVLTGDRETAQDLCQEAFLRTASRLMVVREEGLRSYLFAVVSNLDRSRHRRLAVERRHASALPRDALAPDGSVDLDTAHAVQGSLQRLSGRQRSAIVLRYYADWPDDRIARALRCRPATVRSLLARGRAALRRELEYLS